MDNKILEYQKLDIKIYKLSRELASNQKHGDTQELSKQIKQWQLKILALEEEAKKLLIELDKLLGVEKKGIALVNKFTKTDISKFSVEELKDFDAKTTQTANQLAELDSRIMQHNLQVKKVVLDYEMFRKKILTAKQNRDEKKKVAEDFLKKRGPAFESMQAELAELEKKIEPSLIAKYKALKQDGIFPVLVPLVDTRCGGCRVQLSAGAHDKLKTLGMLECEQCRRTIYIETNK